MNKVIVSMENVEKAYGSNLVVKNMNLDIYEGEFLTLLGPSGCGKTTTLRMIAGFETATSGIIKVEDERVEDKEPFERNVNTVFQSYALFPHMTIYDNVAYGLVVKGVAKDEIRKRVMEILELVQLKGFEKRKPSQLSGGQKQRVAIARALVNRPKVLLLDEPLGALDLKLRKQMQLELKRLQVKLNITFIYVTHDQEEALTMSDRIAIMNSGVIEQLGTPEDIYDKPKTKFVASFIGESNIIDAYVSEKNGEEITGVTEISSFKALSNEFNVGESFSIVTRPEDLRYSKTPVEGFDIEATMKESIYVGNIIKTIFELRDGQEFKMNRLKKDPELKKGDKVYLYWKIDEANAVKTERDDILEILKANQKEDMGV